MREVWRDRWLLVVDKPSGMPTQRTKRSEQGAYDLLQAEHAYVGLHHRLDRPASGLLLFTLDPEANPGITAALQRHEVQRRYRAVLYGDAVDATWEWPVDGRSAVSHVTVRGQARGLSAVEVELQTGRRHQIRVHAAMAGTPVVGDARYGGEAADRAARLALHASHLALVHPVTGEALTFDSPLPDDLQALWLDAGGPTA